MCLAFGNAWLVLCDRLSSLTRSESNMRIIHSLTSKSMSREWFCLVALESCKHFDKESGACKSDSVCEFKRLDRKQYAGKYKLRKFWK